MLPHTNAHLLKMCVCMGQHLVFSSGYMRCAGDEDDEIRQIRNTGAGVCALRNGFGSYVQNAQDNSGTTPTPEHSGRMGGRGGHAGMEEHQIAMLTKKLNLTPDQVT